MNSKVSRRLVATAALAAGLGLFAAGCSAGQVTQTDTQVAAVDGASGDVGSLGVRNAMLAYPHEGNRYQAGEDAPLIVVIANSGATPDKLLSISSPFATGDAEIEGGADLPGQFALRASAEGAEHSTGSSTPHPTSSSAAHSSSSAHGTSSSAPSVTGTSTPGSSSVAPSSTGSPSGSVSGSSSVKPTTSSSKAVSDLPVGQIKIVLKGLVQDVVAGQTIKVTFLFEKAGPLTLDVPVAPSTEARVSEGHEGGH